MYQVQLSDTQVAGKLSHCNSDQRDCYLSLIFTSFVLKLVVPAVPSPVFGAGIFPAKVTLPLMLEM